MSATAKLANNIGAATNATSNTVELKIDDIYIDEDIQPRADGTDVATVSEYATAMKNGAEFPPGRVFDDGKQIWVARGFHRLEARMTAGFDTFVCEIVKGTRFDAILDAAGSNTMHGLRRTHRDTRHVIRKILQEKQWAGRSDRWIASVCGVSPSTVGAVRKQLSKLDSCENGEAIREARIGRDGKTRRVPGQSEPVGATAAAPPDPDHPPTKDGIDLRDYVSRSIGSIEGTAEVLQEVSEDGWSLFNEDSPSMSTRLAAACETLTGLLGDDGHVDVEYEPPPRKSQYTVSERFCSALNDICCRLSGIRAQFGSLDAMFKSKLWNGERTDYAIKMVDALYFELGKLRKEMKDHEARETTNGSTT